MQSAWICDGRYAIRGFTSSSWLAKFPTTSSASWRGHLSLQVLERALKWGMSEDFVCSMKGNRGPADLKVKGANKAKR